MGSWYRQGTASVANNSEAVTGAGGTAWASQLNISGASDRISFDGGGTWYEVATVTDDTHLTLGSPYTGSTIANGAYEVDRQFTGPSAPATAQAQSVQLATTLALLQTNIGAALGGNVGLGSAATPSISANGPGVTATGAANTGLFFPSASGAVSGAAFTLLGTKSFTFLGGGLQQANPIGNGWAYEQYSSSAGVYQFANHYILLGAHRAAYAGYSTGVFHDTVNGAIHFYISPVASADAPVPNAEVAKLDSNACLCFNGASSGAIAPIVSTNILAAGAMHSLYGGVSGGGTGSGGGYITAMTAAAKLGTPGASYQTGTQVWGSGVTFSNAGSSTDNHLSEWFAGVNAFGGRVINDAYNASAIFMEVDGGYASGVTKITFTAPTVTLNADVNAGIPGASTGTIQFNVGNGTNNCIRVYQSDGNSSNSGACVLSVGQNATTGVSIRTGGTITAPGADLAEYETKTAGCGVIKAGDLCAYDASGLLTDKFADAKFFRVKSTDPAWTGNDNWAKAVGPEPADPGPEPLEPAVPAQPASDAEAAELLNYNEAVKKHAAWATDHAAWAALTASYPNGYAAALSAWKAAYEAARATVDRIGKVGSLPVNGSYPGAEVGDYIVAAEAADGIHIAGSLVKAADIAWAQMRDCVGRIKQIDGAGKVTVEVITM